MPQQAYQAKLLKGPFDAIVIGSGIGGLACAAFLSKAGKRVLVLERHYVAGGFTHTFKRRGYEWDVGVHYVGEVHRPNSVLRRLFDTITGGRLGWAPMSEIYDRVCIGDDVYELCAGTQKLKQQLNDYFPQEKAAIDRYFHLVFQVTRDARNFFANRALPPILSTFTRPLMTRGFLRLASQTTREVIGSLTNNPKLLGVLTAQYGDYGLPPRESSFAIHAMVAKHYFEGGSYPVGGSGSIFATIEPVIQQAGGQVLVKADVLQIMTRRGAAHGVRLKNGDEIMAPLVISDAGVANTYGRLLSADDREKFGVMNLLSGVHPSLAHICLYIGIKKSSRDLELGKANYWIYPHYDHDQSIADYLRDPASPLPVAYISFPSAKDPSWDERYPGRATLEVIGFTPYAWFKKWEQTAWMKRGDEYQAYKEKLTERLLEQLFRFVPQVKNCIDHHELSTPLSTRHFCNYENGEIYGIEHTPERFRLKWLKPQTPVKGLYLTGQDIVTDGIGGALFAGVLTASAILKKNLIKQVLAS